MSTTSQDVQNELAAMNKSLTEQITVSELVEDKKDDKRTDVTDTVAEPSSTDKPAEKVRETPADKVRETPSDVDDVVVEDKKEPEPEPDEKDKTIADLRAKLAESEAKPKVETKPEVRSEVKETTPEPIEQDFIGELDVDELTRDPKEFNRLLNKVYRQASKDTRESVMSTLPDIVKSNIAIMEDLKKASEQFYTDNSDLAPFKKVVATVFEELVAANPNKPYGDLIKDVGPDVRKRLGLPEKTSSNKQPEDKSNKSDNPPRLPHKGGKAGRVSDTPSVNPLQSEIGEMNKTLGR
jgi:hypothetical protein